MGRVINPDAFREKRIGLSVIRPRAAVLGLMLLLGLSLWAWQVARIARVGSRPLPSGQIGSAAQEQPATVEAEARFDVESPDRVWQSLHQGAAVRAHGNQAADPLVRSAEVVAIESNPFGIDQAEFQTSTAQTRTSFMPGTSPPQGPTAGFPGDESNAAGRDQSRWGADLVLQSTIVGERRRAALINDKLCREGAEIRVRDETYRLLEIRQGRVVLERAGERIELSVSRMAPTGDGHPAH